MTELSWETIMKEAALGDEDAFAMLEPDSQAMVLRFRVLFRDGHTPDGELVALINTIDHRPPVRLH